MFRPDPCPDLDFLHRLASHPKFESFEKAVRLVAGDPNVDALLVLYVPPIVTTATDVAQAIVRGNEAAKADSAQRGQAPKPILSCFLGSHGVPESLHSLHAGHIPSYAFPEAAAIALAHAVKHGRWLETGDGVQRTYDDVDRFAAEAVIRAACARVTDRDAGTWLTSDETRELLAAYRIATPAMAFATTVEEAVAAADAMGYPVAVKLASETITHKSDVGGVRLHLRTATEVREAFTAIEAALARIDRRGEMSGVTVQRMVTEGIETIVGMTRDESFGPILMFGLGGVTVELLKDVVFRIAPLSDLDARWMTQGIRGAALLEGYRGMPAADRGAIEEVLLRVQQLALDLPEVAEMELNPLKALPPPVR